MSASSSFMVANDSANESACGTAVKTAKLGEAGQMGTHLVFGARGGHVILIRRVVWKVGFGHGCFDGTLHIELCRCGAINSIPVFFSFILLFV